MDLCYFPASELLESLILDSLFFILKLGFIDRGLYHPVSYIIGHGIMDIHTPPVIKASLPMIRAN